MFHSMLLPVSAFASLLPVFLGAEPVGAKNLIENPGFEVLDPRGHPLGWSQAAPTFSLSKVGARTGQHCLQYENRDAKKYILCSHPVILEPGRRYEIGGWVRTEGIEGKDSGATICVEWYGGGNKFLGGCYPPGIKGTRKEWTRIRAITGRVPGEAVSYHVICYLRKGCTGKAWWDDLSLRVYRGPVIAAMTTGLYRGTTAGGMVLVRFSYDFGDYEIELEKVSFILDIQDASGRIVRTIEAEGARDHRGRFQFDSSSLKPGEYRLICRAFLGDRQLKGEATSRLKRVEALPRRKIFPDRYGRLAVNGKLFFPLGTYWSSIKDEQLRIYARSPFNCLMPYGGANREQMDKLQQAGLKIIYTLKDLYAGTRYSPKHLKTPVDERVILEQKVKQFRDHPALLAWYLNDELPLSMVDRLNAHQEWLEELDPNHPTWVVLWQVQQVAGYLKSFDVIGTDPYPIPARPASIALSYTRTTVEQSFGLRPVWMVPQIFNWSSYKKKNGRAPTLLEMRSMAWQCIAGGANGLIFYSFFDLWRMNKTEPFEERWKDVTAMAAEIKSFFPVLLSSPPNDFALETDAPDAIAWRLYEKDESIFLVTVNSSNKPVKATFHLPRQAAHISVLMGDASAAVNGGDLKVSFSKLEPKLLKLDF